MHPLGSGDEPYDPNRSAPHCLDSREAWSHGCPSAVVAALFATWLANGILLQEFGEALTGLWDRPVREHGIFFAIAGGFMILGLVAFVMRHMDSD